MRSFKEYTELKNNHQFETGVCQLLSPVLEGKISFDDLVEQVIIPTFALQPYAENEMDILNLLQESMWDKFKNWIGGGQQSQPQPQPQQSQQDDPEHAKIADSVNKAFEEIITSQLEPAMKKITSYLQQIAFKTGNRQLHQASKLFGQKLLQTAKEMKFKVAGTLSDDQNAYFDKAKTSYTRNQLAAVKQRRTQQTQPQLQGNKPAGWQQGRSATTTPQDFRNNHQRARIDRRMAKSPMS